MGKLGDIAAILGLGIVGGVLFMFATGRWKIPEFKLPEIILPKIDLLPIPTMPTVPVIPPIVPPQPQVTPEEVILPTLPSLAPVVIPREPRIPTGEWEEPWKMEPTPYWTPPPPPPVTYPMPEITPEKVTELKYEYRMTEMERKMRGMML